MIWTLQNEAMRPHCYQEVKKLFPCNESNPTLGYQADINIGVDSLFVELYLGNIKKCFCINLSMLDTELVYTGHWNPASWNTRTHLSDPFNSSPPGQNGRHFADDIFRCIFVNENFCILIKISLKFVPRGPVDNNSAFVYIMAWRWMGDKPLSEQMLTLFTDAYMWH